MNGYDLSKKWYNFRYEKNNVVKPIHSDMYFYIVDLWNRLGQPSQFGLPTDVTMNALGIGSYNTYKKTLSDLIDFGFVKQITASRNQHQSRVIALSKNDKATDKALDKAVIKATDKALDKSLDSINKPLTTNNKPIKREGNSRFKPPSLSEVENYILEKNYKSVNGNAFWNFYESKNWFVGKNKMKDWKKAISGWEARNNEQNGKSNHNTGTAKNNTGYKPATVNTEKLIRDLTEDFENGNIPGQY